MREILFRGKRKDNGEWIEGYYAIQSNHACFAHELKHQHFIFKDVCLDFNLGGLQEFEVIPETVGQYTGLTDNNGKKIFEGDIVQYINSDDFDCQSIVKFGEYKQDGSGGEYGARKCLGFYVDVDNFTCPDWCEDDPEYFPRHMWQQNILEVVDGCEIIGNIYDNPELLKSE